METEYNPTSVSALEQLESLSTDFSTPNAQRPTPNAQYPIPANTPNAPTPNAPTPNAQHPTPFSDLLQLAATKPLLIANGYTLPAGDLLQAAARAEITVACPLMPHLEGQGIGELGQELNEVRADFLANDTLCEMPRLAVEIPASYPLPLPSDDPEESAFFMDRLAYNGATRLFIGLDNDLIDPPLIRWLNEVVASANTAMLPVLVHWIVWFFQFGGGEDDNEESLSEDALITLQWLVGSGVAGIVVTPGDVKKVKRAIRRLSYSECRDVVNRFLSGDQKS
jgi:hypothetical protein